MVNRWTLGEIDRLRALYPHAANPDLLRHFPGRPLSGIQHKASRLGIHKNPDTLKGILAKNAAIAKAANIKGRKITSGGYVLIYAPDHLNGVNGYVMEHRLVMESHIGRLVARDEAVHHIDGDKLNNALENLHLLRHGDHTALHHIGTRRSRPTCELIAQKARERFGDKGNHPSYKHIPKPLLIQTLNTHKSKDAACRALGITKRTLYNKIEDYGLRGEFVKCSIL